VGRLKLKKLDARMSGHGSFTHFMEYKFNDSAKFINCRNWCWQQWGPSCELEFWFKNKDTANQHWCWMMDQWRVRVYFKTEAEAQWFGLKFLE
jgi:hypothetical protein